MCLFKLRGASRRLHFCHTFTAVQPLASEYNENLGQREYCNELNTRGRSAVGFSELELSLVKKNRKFEKQRDRLVYGPNGKYHTAGKKMISVRKRTEKQVNSDVDT